MSGAVRTPEPADLEPALAVLQQVGAAAGRRPSREQLDRWRAELGAAEAVVVVGELDGRVAGLAVGRLSQQQDGAPDHAADAVHLSRLAVAPAARRRGLGSAVVEGFADEAWRRGARRLVTEVPADDAAAAGFCAAVGLLPTARSLPGGAGVEHAAELDPPLRELRARHPGLRLGQLLKLAGLVDTGAQGKALLEEGGVAVNGEVEHRRGRQLEDGDVVVAREQAVRVVLPGPLT